MDEMLNFTVGPVMASREVLEIGAQQTPYFRTAEFSKIMLENEKWMLEFYHAPLGSRAVFLTSSGTGAMESCVMNLLTGKDKAIVVNGGSFGQRFVDLCRLHRVPYEEIVCPFGTQLMEEQLEQVDAKGATAFLVNMDETSSGVLYDMQMIATFCKRYNLFLIVDAISSFMTDELDMERLGAGAVITGSQKALAVPPGVSIVALSPEALNRIESNPEKCMYLSLKDALKNMERGQTPFTPAVTTLLQIHKRLETVAAGGGIETQIDRVHRMALYFREKIQEFPFRFVVEEGKNRSNAVTALRTDAHNAEEIFQVLKDRYHIWICPNGGIYKPDIFRVGHIGELGQAEYDRLLQALREMGI